MTPRTQAEARRPAAEGSRRAMAAASKIRTSSLTDAERAAYADTELCRVHGYAPSHWRHERDGLVLVMEPPR